MKTFKLRLEHAMSSGAALAVLSLPGCSGSVSVEAASGASSIAGAANVSGAPNSSGAPATPSTGGQPTTSIAGEGGASIACDGCSIAGEGGAVSVAGKGGAGGQTEPEPAGAGGTNQQALDPYPVDGLGCSGPSSGGGFGFHGQCCTDALCYAPTDGKECVAADDAPEKLGRWWGSGSCLCGGRIQGPFAANPAHAPSEPGTCCYVIGSIGCDGRPLLVDGTPIVSELRRRSDWISSELLELVA